MGTLHVVATPIGNLEDVTLRALRVLGEVDLIFAEDTRRTRILLDRHGIDARPRSLHAHNEQSRIAQALDRLARGESVALVSDAGTPLVSDPGERLVRAVAAAGHRVEALPGASAVIAALTVSALAPQPFTFVGFPPRRAGERRAFFAQYRERLETLVLFESPRRLAKTLSELLEVLGDRPACVARELTKLHEEIRRGTLAELAAAYADGALGEVTIVVGGRSATGADETSTEPDDRELDAQIRALLAAGKRPKEVAATLARKTSVPRRALYARAVELRAEAGGPRSGGTT